MLGKESMLEREKKKIKKINIKDLWTLKILTVPGGTCRNLVLLMKADRETATSNDSSHGYLKEASELQSSRQYFLIQKHQVQERCSESPVLKLHLSLWKITNVNARALSSNCSARSCRSAVPVTTASPSAPLEKITGILITAIHSADTSSATELPSKGVQIPT